MPPAHGEFIANLETVDTVDDLEWRCYICQQDLPELHNSSISSASNNSGAATEKDKVVDKVLLKRVPCGHVFDAACINAWLQLHATCPTCRREFPTANQLYNWQKHLESALVTDDYAQAMYS